MPQNVSLIVLELIDHPKSHNFIIPLIKLIIYIVKDDILWLEIPMNDLTFMHVIQCLESVFKDNLCQIFRQSFFLFQKTIQLPRVTQLHHQVYVPFVRKEGVQLDNVRVVQIRLNLDFPDQLDD